MVQTARVRIRDICRMRLCAGTAESTIPPTSVGSAWRLFYSVLIKKSTKVYSVTGTACMEAFYLQKPWKMLGDNFLSLYFKENKNTSTYDFTLDTLKVSGNFVLYTPPNKKEVQAHIYIYKRTEAATQCRLMQSDLRV